MIIKNNIKLRGLYIPQSLLRNFIVENKIDNSLKIKSKNFIITKELLNHEILVYSGKSFQLLLIKFGMIGHKIGEFIITRQFSYKNLQLKKRRKYRRKKKI